MAEDPVAAAEPAEPDAAAPAPAAPERRWPPATVLGLVLVVIGLLAIAYAFLASDDGSPAASTTRPPVTSSRCAGEVGDGSVRDGHVAAPPTVAASTPFAAGRKPLCGFAEVGATATDARGAAKQLCLLLAETQSQQERGLMGVRNPSLGGYDGMAFVFGIDQQGGGFYMRDTPMPLSIAYVDAAGTVVNVQDMSPCGDVGTCPTYPSGGPFRTAIEVPKGRLPALGIVEGAKVHVVPGTTCRPRTG